MKIKVIRIVFLAVLAVVVVLGIIFIFRPPVLIVFEQAFAVFYGEERIRRGTISASIALFRPVRNVLVANDASDDIVPLVVSGVSSNPFCVIFPLRFAHAARMYQEQNPHIPVVILEGRYARHENPSSFAIGENRENFFIFKTDVEGDFYRAGVAAAGLAVSQFYAAANASEEEAVFRGQSGLFGVFLADNILSPARDAFLQGLDYFPLPGHIVNQEENGVQALSLEAAFYTSYQTIRNRAALSGIVIAGVAHQYLERQEDVPFILFSWLNPSLVPDGVALIINDSPWVQVVPAARMVSAGVSEGVILSNFNFIDREIFNRRILRQIRKTW